MTGHCCNLFDVTRSPLTLFIAETRSECGFHCGMSSDCENFDLCLDASPSNGSFNKTIPKQTLDSRLQLCAFCQQGSFLIKIIFNGF